MENMHCKVCGGFCRECGSALWKTAYKCEGCGVKYRDRSEKNIKYTMGAPAGRRI